MTEQETSVSETAKVVQPQLNPLNIPAFYSATFETTWNSNEFSVLLMRGGTFTDQNGGLVVASVPMAQIITSPQGAKDLILLLADALKNYEDAYGEITTYFTKSRAQAAVADPA